MNSRIDNKEDRRRLLDAIDAAQSSWLTYGPYLDWLAMQLETAKDVDATDECELRISGRWRDRVS